MTTLNNRDYYLRRAEQASALAEAATMPSVRKIHRDMAAQYTTLAEPEAARPVLALAS